MKKQKQTLEHAQPAAGARHPFITKITKFQGPVQYIYDSEEPVALSLGLIILRGQCISGDVVRAIFLSDTPPKCLHGEVLEDVVQGLGITMSGLATSQPLMST